MSSLRHVISEAEDLGSSIEEDVNIISPGAASTAAAAAVVVSGMDSSSSSSSSSRSRMDVVENDGIIPSSSPLSMMNNAIHEAAEHHEPLEGVDVSNVLHESGPHNNILNNNIIDEITYPTSRLLQNDIPPSIQSLQQQYYSSSSLSGDEDEDENDPLNNDHHHDDDVDEPLIHSDLLQPPSRIMNDNNNLQTIESMGVPPHSLISQQQQQLPLLMRGGGGGAVVVGPGGGMTRMASGSASSTQSGESSSLQARSSQNSSRDWGWFDDVHATTHSTEMIMHHPTGTNGMAKIIPGGSSGGGGGTGGIMDSRYSHKHNRVTIVDPMLVMNNDDDDNRNMMMHAMAVTAPHYVLEESLSSQFLWKNSAGQRPPQPVEERAFYEKMWAQNFERSNVEYNMPVELLTATSPLSLDPFSDSNLCDTVDYAHQTVGTVPLPMDNTDYHHHAKGTAVTDIAEAALVYRMNDDRNPYSNNSNYPNNRNNDALHNYHSAPMKREVKDTSGDGTLTVLVRGDNVFGTTVSKSFARTNANGDPIAGGVDTINISIASYRVVESTKHGKFAQFLVIYRQGSIRDTIGIWKRYRDFEELAHKVTQAHEGCVAAFANISPLHTVSDNDQETEHLPNAITSWRLLKKRKRWYRCLDAGYLSLKVFLLERFLHDILFESSSPHLLRDFVGVDL